MKRIALVLIGGLVVSTSLYAQEKKEAKKEEAKKIEISINETDENGEKAQAKVEVTVDGKVVFSKEGDAKEVMREFRSQSKELGLKDPHVMVMRRGERGANKWVSKDGEDVTIAISGEGEGDGMMFIAEGDIPAMGKDGKMLKMAKGNKMVWNSTMPMNMPFGNKSKVKVFDYDKKDKDLKVFNVKKLNDIKFENFSSSVEFGVLHVSYLLEEKGETTITLKDSEGNKILSKFFKSSQGEMFNAGMGDKEPGVYLLEIKVGKANWLQKIIVE